MHVSADIRLEARDAGLGLELEHVATALSVFPSFKPILGLSRFKSRKGVVAVLTVNSKRLTRLQRGIPDCSGCRKSHGAVAIVGISSVSDVFVLHVIVCDGLSGPGVSVGTVRSAHIGIVEESELSGDLSVIRHDFFTQHTE